MIENSLELATLYMSVALPEAVIATEIISASYKVITSLSDKILLSKLQHVLINQDSDFNEWLKLTEKFDKDNKNYGKTVKKMVFLINSINEEELLDVYSNLMRSYKQELIDKNRFFKLAWGLANIYSQDLFALTDFYAKTDIYETKEGVALKHIGLLDSIIVSKYGKSPAVYNINDLGIDMLRCGLDLENYNEYKD